LQPQQLIYELMIRTHVGCRQCVALAVILVVCVAFYGEAAAETAAPATKSLSVRRATARIQIDGRLDEPDWAACEKVTLVGYRPDEILGDSTECRILWDDDFLYLSWFCTDRDAWGTYTVRDEPLYNEEVVEAFINPDGDRETYIELDEMIHSQESNQEQASRLIQLLNMKRSERWLDVCCGHGRYLLPMVSQGFRVSGLDASPDMMKALERRATRQGVVANVIRCDMREIPFSNFFHGAFLLGTSFGIFEDFSEDVRALHSIRRSIIPGGKFLIDQVNPTSLFQNGPQEKRTFQFREQTITEEILLDDSKAFYILHRVLQRGSWTKEWTMRYRYYSVTRLTETLLEAGFLPIDLFGELGGTPYHQDSPRLVVCCLRKN